MLANVLICQCKERVIIYITLQGRNVFIREDLQQIYSVHTSVGGSRSTPNVISWLYRYCNWEIFSPVHHVQEEGFWPLSVTSLVLRFKHSPLHSALSLGRVLLTIVVKIAHSCTGFQQFVFLFFFSTFIIQIINIILKSTLCTMHDGNIKKKSRRWWFHRFLN